MSEPFLGEIKMVGFNFAPRDFADCNGQLLAISQNSALFSLLGTTYGGDGRTIFALPDLRGRVPVHTGTGPGLTNRELGTKSGTETVALTPNQLPAHSHPLTNGFVPTTDAVGNQTSPDGNRPATANDGESNYSDGPGTGGIELAGNTANSGSNQAHANMPPFLAIRFVIALAGIFPSRS